jgi:hypothetical protein
MFNLSMKSKDGHLQNVQWMTWGTTPKAQEIWVSL